MSDMEAMPPEEVAIPWHRVKQFMRQAWDEGHTTRWVRESDNCMCKATGPYNCTCGEYGMDRIITPNPYGGDE